MTTYKIVRKFQSRDVPDKLIETGLTLAEAQAHCNDKNTSSATATSKSAQAITEKFGPWFDCYYEE